MHQLSVKESLKEYHLAAQRGEAEAQVKLGIGLIDKEDQPNFTQAFFWFDSAAKQRNVLGRLHAGFCYEYGLGINADAKAAFNHYQLAAQSHQAEALTILGFSYERGLGTVLDCQRAVACYKKAADQGFWAAISRLNDLNEEYKQDPTQVWLLKGREPFLLLEAIIGEIIFGINPQKQTIPEKLSDARELYKTALVGLATKCSKTTAATHWFHLSASLGHSYAQVAIGLRYELGQYGLSIDREKAEYWYRLSAEQGDKIGQYFLANYYMGWNGVRVDILQAVLLYKKAAAQGHEESKKKIQELRSKMNWNGMNGLFIHQAAFNGEDVDQAYREKVQQALDDTDGDDMNDPTRIAIEPVKRSTTEAEEWKLKKGSSKATSSASSSQVASGSSSSFEHKSSTGLQNVVADSSENTPPIPPYCPINREIEQI